MKHFPLSFFCQGILSQQEEKKLSHQGGGTYLGETGISVWLGVGGCNVDTEDAGGPEAHTPGNQ